MTDRQDAADAELVLRSRSGDRHAYAELWRRHYRSGIVVARSISPAADSDDLVQEAFTRIYHAIQRGGGPTGSFRAYLFTSIRNTAADWGRGRRETTIDELEAMADPASTDQATADSLDQSLTHQAFQSLPARWQEVLWYSEIEGMKPAQIAPLLGMNPTAVAQLSFRAREGLREAWVQAHLRSAAEDSECAWTIARLGAYARDNLARRERPRLERHLESCQRCAAVAGEAQEVSNRLALVLVPLTIGVGGAAAYLATLQTGAPVIALAAMPSAVVEGAVIAGGAGAGGAGVAASAGGAAGSSTAAASAAGGVAGASTAGASVAGGAAGAAATVGAAGAAGGAALSSGTVLGLAAAAVAVAGTVAVGVVLPQAGPEASVPANAVAQSPAPSAAAAADERRDAGPSPSDLPVLRRSVDAVRDAGPSEPAPLPGSATPNESGNAEVGADANPDANADGSGNKSPGANANANVRVNANGGANANANGSANGNANATGNGSANGSTNGNGNGSANANGNANGNSTGGGNPGLPGGSPAFVSSSSQTTSGQTVVDVVISGAAGATVEARIRGTVHASATIGADGRVVLTLRPSAQDISVDARVDLRYTDGSASGPPAAVRLSALL